MKCDAIEAGDIVIVSFNGAQYTFIHKAKVLYTPCATGDSWHFQDMMSGQIHYVSEGCTISLMQKEDRK